MAWVNGRWVRDEGRTDIGSGLAGTQEARNETTRRQQGSLDLITQYGPPTSVQSAASFTPPTPVFQPSSREEVMAGFDFGNVQIPGVGQPYQVPTPWAPAGIGGQWNVPVAPASTPSSYPSISQPATSGGQYIDGRWVPASESNQQVSDPSTPFESAYQAYLDEQLAQREAVRAGLTEQYGERLNQLQEELAKYKGGLANTNKAYGDYADDANAIFEEWAATEVDPLDPTAVPQTVERSYDDFGGQMGELLGKIDKSGNTYLAAEMADQVRDMEQISLDSLRAGIADQDKLHDLSGSQAQALANMAWKDDLYNAERARTELEMEINASIDAKAQQITDTRDEMNKAIADAVQKYPIERLDPDELWRRGFTQMFAEKGYNEAEIAEMTAVWEGIYADSPEARDNYTAFKSSVNEEMNYELLSNLGYMNQVGNVMGEWAQLAASDDEQAEAYAALMEEVNRLMSSPMTGDTAMRLASVTGLEGLAKSVGAGFDDALATVQSRYDPILDLWDYQRNFADDYEKHLSEQAISQNYTQGGQAPNNYANRYTSDYVYRREVVAPHYADLIKRTFPDYGIRIGGLGYMRPPSDVGGGKAANSDHQSGGAIDVYADTKQQLYEIERWAQSQPGISLVVHSGNAAHEGHHVHVSFQVGHRV